MTDDQQSELVDSLTDKMTTCANEFMHSPENVELTMSEVSIIAVHAALNALTTFAFSKLSEKGIEDGEQIIESLVGGFKTMAKIAIRLRREELASCIDADEADGVLPNTCTDPWE